LTELKTLFKRDHRLENRPLATDSIAPESATITRLSWREMDITADHSTYSLLIQSHSAAVCIPKRNWTLIYLFPQPCQGQFLFQSPADQAVSLSACIWAVGRKRPPLCRGCAPATPP